MVPGHIEWVERLPQYQDCDYEYVLEDEGVEPLEVVNNEPGIRQPKRELARRAITALFPNGVPDCAELPNKLLERQVCTWLEAHGYSEVKSDSILRAAGRRK
jgi:hypothetical protein